MRLSRKHLTDLERFWKYARKSEDCWQWLGRIDDSSHSRFDYVGRRNGYGHRFAYEQFCGPIPVGYELHHNCLNPRCVNPSHLRLLTRSEHRTLTNLRQRFYEHKQYCVRGHRLDDANRVAHINRGTKHYTICRECRRIRRWLSRRGLKMSTFTLDELKNLVPPRR